ncbi:MAG: hypothetical protein ACXAAO_00370 [Candidatus Thorarchaeota archaeon]|jgi:hypothetical protein
MQAIIPITNPFVLIGGALILVVLIIIFGYRNRGSGYRYWTVSIGKILTVFVIWQVTSTIAWVIILTYSGDPQRVFYSDIVNAILYFGLTFLLVLSEIRRRSQPRLDIA